MKQTDLLGLRTTVYKVPDLQAAKEWYSKTFKVKPYFDEDFYIGFNIGGYELGLLPQEVPVSQKSDGVVAYWGVEDIQGIYQRFMDQGAREHEKPYNVGGELMVASVWDPWNNVIGLIYNPAFHLE